MRRIVAATLLCAVLTGCGHDADTSPAPAATSSSATDGAGPSTPTEQATADVGVLLQPDPTIVNPHPIPFGSWTKIGESRLAVHFDIGSPECYGVDVRTTETTTAITVELRSGMRPTAVGKMCTMIAMMASLEIQLKSPIGNRTVTSAA